MHIDLNNRHLFQKYFSTLILTLFETYLSRRLVIKLDLFKKELFSLSLKDPTSLLVIFIFLFELITHYLINILKNIFSKSIESRHY